MNIDNEAISAYHTDMKRADAKAITHALIKWLDNRYQDKTITTEMSVNTSYGTKVADVVISNGHAIAFEIKSDFDTTTRLSEQINGFSEIFEYVYVVFWKERFSIEELNLPTNIGAVEAYWSKSGTLHFNLLKKAKINRFLTPVVVGNLLWKSELEYFLHLKNIVTKKSYDKSTLVNLFIKNYNKQESVKIFRFVVKKRFEKGYLAYQQVKHTTDALRAFIQFKTDKDYLLKLQA